MAKPKEVEVTEMRASKSLPRGATEAADLKA